MVNLIEKVERLRLSIDSSSACVDEVADHNAKVDDLLADLRKKETTRNLFCGDCDAKPGEECSGPGTGYHPARFFGKPDLLTKEERAIVDHWRSTYRPETLLAIIDRIAPVRR